MKRAEAEEALAKVATVIFDCVPKHNAKRLSQDAGASGVPSGGSSNQRFEGDPRVDELIKGVKLADWDAAAEAAPKIITLTSQSGEELHQDSFGDSTGRLEI